MGFQGLKAPFKSSLEADLMKKWWSGKHLYLEWHPIAPDEKPDNHGNLGSQFLARRYIRFGLDLFDWN